MKITVSSPSVPAATWSYVTMFDGQFRPVTGQEGSETAVEVINEKSTRIYNKRNGVVNQVVINTLSDDHNKMENEYVRMDKDGKITGVTHATYIRRKKSNKSGSVFRDCSLFRRGRQNGAIVFRRARPHREIFAADSTT